MLSSLSRRVLVVIILYLWTRSGKSRRNFDMPSDKPNTKDECADTAPQYLGCTCSSSASQLLRAGPSGHFRTLFPLGRKPLIGFNGVRVIYPDNLL